MDSRSSEGDHGAMVEPPAIVRPFLAKASRVARSPVLLAQISRQVKGRLRREGSVGAALDSVRADLAMSLALVKAWRTGSYRNVAGHSVILLLGGLLYFVTPADAVPDLIPGVGLLDDATVLSLVFAQLGEELARFRAWQANQESPQAEIT